MAHQSSKRVVLLVCVLFGSLAASQAILEKAFASDLLLGAAKKNGVSSHLQRIFQVEPELEVDEPKEPTGPGTVCSPAALTPQRDCRAAVTAPSAEEPSCTGDDCLIAPMPGAAGAPTGSLQSGPGSRMVVYGPMTQDAHERMVIRRRTALREKLMKEGRLTELLDSFLSEPPLRYDVGGIPIPAEPSPAPADAIVHPHVRADFEMRFKPQSPAPANDAAAAADGADRLPTRPAIRPATRPDADFTSKYDDGEQVAPSPAPQRQATLADTKESSSSAQQRVAASPEGADTWLARDRLRAETTARLEMSARRLANAQQRAKAQQQAEAAPQGPGRPPMTEAEAAKLPGPQRAANAAAAAAAARRRRAAVAAAAAALLAETANPDYAAMPAVSEPAGETPVPKDLLARPATKAAAPKAAAAAAASSSSSSSSSTASEEPLAGSPTSLYTGPEPAEASAKLAQQEMHRRHVSDIERVLMLETPPTEAAAESKTAAAANAANGKANAKKLPSPAESASAAQARRRAAAAADEVRRQRAKAEARRAAVALGRWELLDWLCVGALLLVVPVAVFMAAAVLEEAFVAPRPGSSSSAAAASAAQAQQCSRPRRQAGTPLLLHWLALTRCLWRRTRRAFAAARKHLTGHASHLPTCAAEADGPATALARALAAAAAAAHVFWSHLCDLRHTCSSSPSSSPFAAAAASPFSSPGHPFSDLGLGLGGASANAGGVSGGEGAQLVLQADDTATATAMAELQVRRRH